MATSEITYSPVWHTDPGHGWLQVPRSSCRGLPLEDVYVLGDDAYLEEDCEATIWLCHHGYIDGRITTDPFPRVEGCTRWLTGGPDLIPTIFHEGRFPELAGLIVAHRP